MKQLLTDVTPLFLKPETLTENVNGGKLLISGVLQTANKKNQNDRVYPKEILERECEKYLTEFVKPRRGMGELDHPACLRPSAQILTNTGWKYIKDVSIGEYAMTLNLENDEIEYNPIEEVINESYEGKMISIKGNNIDTLCTPNHRFILKDRHGKFIEKTAQEICELSKFTQNQHLSIPISEDRVICEDISTLIFTEIDYNDTVHCVSIKNKNFYCIDEHKPFWTGNSEIVNLKNVSHTVIDMKWDGEDLVGTIEILPTPSGEILKKLIESNILLGISSRGVGSVKQDIREGSNIVQDDFNLICFDIVSNPSTYGAFMTPKSLNESANSKLHKQFVKHQSIERVFRNIISEI